MRIKLMALPEKIRVKLSSEEAGYVSITPVVVQQMAVRELIELILGFTGKDTERIHELLLRGALVRGSSRYRWDGWEADRADIQAILETFPGDEPLRPFEVRRCVRAVLHGRGLRIELPRDVAARRRLFRRRSYWDVLMGIAGDTLPGYVDYSYQARADRYQVSVSNEVSIRLRQSADALGYTALARRIREARIEKIEFFTERE